MGRMLALISGLCLAARAEQFPVRAYTTADGLARNNISSIAQDSRGFLWFSTFEGLSRFDGQSFTNFDARHGLPSNAVRAFLEAHDKTYWVAAYGGLCRLKSDAGTPRFEVYRPAPVVGDPPIFSALLQDRTGTLWAGASSGLYRVDTLPRGGVALRHLDLPGSPARDGTVTGLAEDAQGGLWVATREDGLYRRLPDGRVAHYARSGGFPTNDILALRIDRQGRLWVGTTDGLLQMRVAGNQAIIERNYRSDPGWLGSWIDSIAEAPDGALWVATALGLVKMLAGGDQAHDVVAHPTLEGRDRVRGDLLFDRDGNLWIGTEGEGVLKVGAGGLTTYRESDGLPAGGKVNQLLENAANELCAVVTQSVANGVTRLLLCRLLGPRFSFSAPRIPRHVRYAGWGWGQVFFQAHDGEWWIATGEGLGRFPAARSIADLARLQPKAFYTTRDGLNVNNIFRLWEDSRGDVWLGGNLTLWERATGRFHRLAKDGPTALGEDRLGNVWAGLYRGGIVRYGAGKLTVFGAADGVPPGFVSSVHCDRAGRLWFGTGLSGLVRILDPGAEHPRFAAVSVAQGLSSVSVRSIAEDRHGLLYLVTGRGIDRFDPDTGRVRHYTAADGLPTGDPRLAYADRHGNLWFVIGNAVVVRLGPEPELPRLPPAIFLTALDMPGFRSWQFAKGETEAAALSLESNQNHLRIDFAGLDFGPGQTLSYQYKLEGSGRDWSAPTEQRSVNFGNLAPSSYRFLVRAVNSDGLASAQPATLNFTIRPPLWQRGWFLALARRWVCWLMRCTNTGSSKCW